LHQLSSADANNQQAILNLGFIEANTGEILMQQGKVSKGLHSVQKAITIFRAAPGSKNLWIATGLSECYADLGSGYAALAERAISLREKLEYWREARSWYEKGMDIWTDNPKSGGLDAFGHNQAAQLSQEIAKCDVGLRAMARAKRPRN
jgi:tetratricopeptide (TPR) repeat protein